MKRSIRIIGVAILTAIYCLTVNTAIGLPTVSDYGTPPATEQEQYLLAISNHLYCPILPSERSINSFHSSPVSNFKNPSIDSWGTIEAEEKRYGARMAQYSYFAVNLPVRHRISDIIFPFHYFW